MSTVQYRVLYSSANTDSYGPTYGRQLHGQRDVIQVIQDTDVDLIQTWYTVFTDLVYRLYRPGIQIIQTWYTVFTDLVYRLYRPGIQIIQTGYTVFTDLVYRLYSLPGYRLLVIQ